MSEHYLRILREELRSKTLSSIPPSRVNSIRKAFENAYVELHDLPDVSREVLKLTIEKTMRDLERLSTIRLVKTIMLKQIDQNSIDKEIGKYILLLLEAEKAILSPFTLGHSEKYYFKFKAKCEVDNKLYKPGEIALLTISEFIEAVLKECGQPITHPVIKIFSTLQNNRQ